MTAPSPISIDNSLRIAMRDGVFLGADLYLPRGNGPFATLLCRTPYNRDTVGPFAIRAAREGFAVVVQDVRGRWGSEGEWVPFVNEQRDGYDTCAWICDQSWCAGSIGTFGGSYVGLTQWQAALAGAPGLRAMAPAITGSNYHHGWTYQGGAFELGFNLSWTLGLAQNNAERLGGGDLDAVIDRYDGIDLAFGRMPLAGDPLLSRVAPWYDEWLRHPDFDEFWAALSIEGRYGELDIACFHTGGWLDIFLGGTVRNYVGMRTGAKTAWAREHQYLVVNPRDHYTYSNGWPMGEYDPGVRSANAYIDLDGQTLRFFDRTLRGADSVPFDGGNVSLFVMGEDAWRTEPEWPLTRAVATDFYLHSDGNANTREGNGTLWPEPPTGNEPVDRFTYDPLNPVPTVGGPLCGHISKLEWGRRDQRAVEMRPDVLVYSTGILAEAMEVTGPIAVTLYAASSAVDTDWTAKLVDVQPDGAAINVIDGILRARYRESMSDPTLLTPGEVYQYEIDLTATSYVFGQGHQIRLEISSSNFPRFDRNPNTGGVIAETAAADCEPAVQTIFHTADYPSRITLPLVPSR